MRSQHPPCIAEPSKTDNDRFDMLQVRLLDPRTMLIIKAKISNMFFMQQLNDFGQANQQPAVPIHSHYSFFNNRWRHHCRFQPITCQI